MAHVVSVEEVGDGKALARFTELPHALHGGDPCFAPMVMAWERYRLDPRRNPFFEQGDGAYFLARRLGRPVGRITAHVAARGAEGWFGFWWVDDDSHAAAALVDAAHAWLAEQGCTTMTGPLSFTTHEEAGVLVAGHDRSGLTGRPWHPPHLARLLEELGFHAVGDRPTWRLPTSDGGRQAPVAGERPGHAGPYGDPRVVLDGIAAVPDISEVLRTSRLRSAWGLAARARRADWDTCTVVRCTTDPAAAVPALQAAARTAGYRWVVAPWTPDPNASPETVHRLYRRDL